MAGRPNREDLIARLKALAVKRRARHVSRDLFCRETGVLEAHILDHFRSYSAFVTAAGLEPYTRNLRRSDDELFVALRDAWNEAGGPVAMTVYDRMRRHRYPCYQRRWKSGAGVLTAFRAWIEGNDPTFAHLPALRAKEEEARGSLPLRRSMRRYGAVLDLPFYRHAPVNEQGVVLLFGMMAERLGFIIEGAGPGFPDCDAKRRAGDGWEAVRIEFELESRNFRAHGHDEGACDLIVCWENNWKACPLEVLELKSTIEGLRRAGDARPREARVAGAGAPP